MALADIDINTLILTAAVSFLVATASLMMVARYTNRRRSAARALASSADNAVVFLFDDDCLIDATLPAHQMLKSELDHTTDWARFLASVRARFPSISDEVAQVTSKGRVSVPAADPQDMSRIDAEWWDGLIRIELVDDDTPNGDPGFDRTSLMALEHELGMLRSTVAHAPQLVWQESAQGEVIWANGAYLDFAHKLAPDRPIETWPLPQMFDRGESLLQGADEGSKRVAVSYDPQGDKYWFDRKAVRQGETVLSFAVPADEIVRSENALRDFVQTLTKTFAHLPIGLAIFDRKRELALFNPALIDLTALPFEFLSAHPTLFSFLDRLRDKKMMPEPKDYKSWRQQMAELEAEAANGEYEDTWTLPTGQTYRVTGRPHPDGAVAFLFEDISSEVSLTRHFRMELETGQAVIDAQQDAIAVFSSLGILTLSNVAYSKLWGDDPGTGFGEISILDATRSWQELTRPTPVWGEVRDFVQEMRDRCEWHASVIMLDGQKLECRFTPLAAGSTLVSFHRNTGAVRPNPEPHLTASTS